jgi:pyruvyltransferase
MNTIKFKTELYKYLTKTKNVFSKDFLEYIIDDPILLYYSDFSKNWGDYINPFLVEKITGRKAVSYKRIYNPLNKPKLFGVGSILHHPGLDNAIVWGSGFIYPPKNLKGTPSKILALRGKGSATILENFGIKHNNIFGDPALLFPTFYQPKRNKRFKIGFIPHYSELEFFCNNSVIQENKDVTIISPMVKNDEVFQIIDQICECEVVVSSSLHGLILTDAYQIPSLRFTFTNKLVGGDFKFNDYYSGVGINHHDVFHIDDLDTINYSEAYRMASIKELNFDPGKLSSTILNHLGGNN